jgi:hypothetical protein
MRAAAPLPGHAGSQPRSRERLHRPSPACVCACACPRLRTRRRTCIVQYTQKVNGLCLASSNLLSWPTFQTRATRKDPSRSAHTATIADATYLRACFILAAPMAPRDSVRNEPVPSMS